MKINRHGKAEALSKEEFFRVLNDIPAPIHRAIFAMCWYTTERPITVLRLHVTDVMSRDKLRSAIVFSGSTRKDGKTREVPIHAKLASELKRYLQQRQSDSDWLFPAFEDGDRHLPRDTYSKYLARTFSRLEMAGFTSYSTRRGSLTHLARTGINLRTIQAVSGHSSLASLQRYLEVSLAEVEATIAVL